MKQETTTTMPVRIGPVFVQVVGVPVHDEDGRATVKFTDGVRAERLAARHLLRRHRTETLPWNPELIRFCRHTLGLKAKDLAAMLGVRDEAVSRWESTSPSAQVLRLLEFFVDAALTAPDGELPASLLPSGDIPEGVGREYVEFDEAPPLSA